MISTLRKLQFMVFEDYPAFEAETRERHQSRNELVGGYPHEMAPENDAHYDITGNLFRALNLLPKQEHEEFEIEMKGNTRTVVEPIIYYPDIVVSCARSKAAQRSEIREQPSLIIEVLSPSTERLDRCEKELNCRQIPLLPEFVLVAGDRPKVEIMRRHTSWTVEELYPDERLDLESAGQQIPSSSTHQSTAF